MSRSIFKITYKKAFQQRLVFMNDLKNAAAHSPISTDA